MWGSSPATVGLRSDASDEGSQDSRGHSAPPAEQPKLPTPRVDEAPSDLGARWQRYSEASSEHERPEQPRPMGTKRMVTRPSRLTDSPSVKVRLERARRRFTVARETTLRRRQRVNVNQRRVDDAEREEKEASAPLTSAEWATGQQARVDDSVAVAPSPSPVRVRDVHSRSARLGDEAFLNGSVSFSEKRHEFAADSRTAVIETASALLTSVRLSFFQSPELLSVRQAWSDMDHSSWSGQQKAGPTLVLVTALRKAHDATEAPVLWPTPEEALEELRRTKKWRVDSRDERGYRHGDGGSMVGGGHGGGSGNGGVGDSHQRRGGGNSGGGRGGTPGGGRSSGSLPNLGRGSRYGGRSSGGRRGG